MSRAPNLFVKKIGQTFVNGSNFAVAAGLQIRNASGQMQRSGP